MSTSLNNQRHKLISQDTFNPMKPIQFEAAPLKQTPRYGLSPVKEIKNKYIESIAKYRDFISRASDYSIQSLRDMIEIEEMASID